MDPISYGVAAKQKQRIEKVIAEPDSTSGVITVPQVIAAGETITVPAGRVAVLPNIQVDGTLNVQGDVFIPSGATFSKVVETEGNQTIAGVKTFSSTIIGSINGNSATATTCPDFGIGVYKILTETNLNNYLSGGKFITPATGLSNLPTGWAQGRYVIDVSGGTNYASQLLANPHNRDVAIRSYNGMVWTSWEKLVTVGVFTGDNQNKSTTGYQKLPGGVIIQWGQVTTNNGVGVWTFPIAFPTICAQVFVSQDAIDPSISVGAHRKIGAENAQADIRSELTTGGDAFYAWAIGY